MLKSFYEYLGFFGSLFLSLAMFILFIFWVAGLAGITLPVDGGKPKYNKWKVLVAVLVPVYPVYWVIKDMLIQFRFMKKD